MTLYLHAHGIGTPIAWMLTNSKEAATYEDFLRTIANSLNNTWTPVEIFCDFEKGLQRGCKLAFSNQAQICGDAFHFIQANVKWFRQNGLASQVTRLVPHLRRLWGAPSIEEYLIRLPQFLDAVRDQPSYPFYFLQFNIKLILILNMYITYFNNTWGKPDATFAPDVWALFGRAMIDDEVRSGSQCLEGYNVCNYFI